LFVQKIAARRNYANGNVRPRRARERPPGTLIHRIGCNDAMNQSISSTPNCACSMPCFNNGAPKMSATKFHVGDRVEDKKTHERGRVTFVYSTLEIRDEFIAVLFNGHDEALAVPADSVRKVSTRQS
jgi:hypothetical protein